MASRTGEGLCAPLVRWTWPKRESTQDYFLAGQRMPCFIVAMSMFASLTNAVSYTGIPGTAYTENIALVVLGVSSIAVTPLLALTFYPVYRRLNVTTSYEYVYHRFGLAGRFAVSGLFILDRLAWLGTVIYAPAKALNVATRPEIWVAILLMGVQAVSYTVLGGLSAVLWTDVIQFTPAQPVARRASGRSTSISRVRRSASAS